MSEEIQHRAALARALATVRTFCWRTSPGQSGFETGKELNGPDRELTATLENEVIMVNAERRGERYANRLVFLGDEKLVGESWNELDRFEGSTVRAYDLMSLPDHLAGSGSAKFN